MSLLIGHVVLLIALRLGEPFVKFVRDLFNLIIHSTFNFSFVTFTVKGNNVFDRDRPIIIVSNHQSMIDIPFIGWVFRRNNPKFVAKVELSKGAPYVSLSLRNGAGVLIDRKSPSQAVNALEQYAKIISQNNSSICIFPEGTRARDGKIKPFKGTGLKVLLRAMPNALIVPIAIDRSWELVRYKMFPVPFGIRVRMKIFPSIEPKTQEPEVIIKKIEALIREEIRI